MSKRKSSDTSRPTKMLRTSQQASIETDFERIIETDDVNSSFDESLITVDSQRNSSASSSAKSSASSSDTESDAALITKRTDNKSVKNNFVSLTEELKTKFWIKDVPSDGNCFYHAVLSALNLDSINHLDLRRANCEFLKENQDFFIDEAYTREQLEIEIKDQLNEGRWAISIFIYSLSLLLKITIEIFIPAYSKPVLFNEGQLVQISLYNHASNHFQVLFSKDLFDSNLRLKETRSKSRGKKENKMRTEEPKPKNTQEASAICSKK